MNAPPLSEISLMNIPTISQEYGDGSLQQRDDGLKRQKN